MSKPVNPFEIEELQFSSASDKVRRVVENYPYVAHLVGGALTTAGVQYGTESTQSTGATSKSTAIKTNLSSTLNWPGLEGKYIDEAEFGLTVAFKSTAVAATTIGYVWQIKSQGETTWTNISAVETTKGSTVAAYTERTVSGYRLYRDGSLAAGYNRLPLNIRLRFFSKGASAGKIKVKSSSYIAIKPR